MDVYCSTNMYILKLSQITIVFTLPAFHVPCTFNCSSEYQVVLLGITIWNTTLSVSSVIFCVEIYMCTVYAIKYRLTTSLCTTSNKFNSSALSVVTTTRRCFFRQQLGGDFVVSHNPKDPALTLGVFFISSKHWSTTSCAQKKQQHKWCCKSSKTLGNLYKEIHGLSKKLAT